LFYAFYGKNWQGTLQFRGLTSDSYKLVDYVNHKDIGIIEKDKPELNINFEKYLLLMAYPVK